MIPLLFSIVLVACLWLLAAQALRRSGRAPLPPDARFDAIVVLGARVRPDGTPSPALARRVELGCALLREGRAPKLVVTGGRVGGPITEAEAALRYVTARTLAPLDRIVLEPHARTTRDNARLTRALLGDVHVLVVTDDWHVARARRIFARAFCRVACAGAAGRIRGALREVPALVIELARPR